MSTIEPQPTPPLPPRLGSPQQPDSKRRRGGPRGMALGVGGVAVAALLVILVWGHHWHDMPRRSSAPRLENGALPESLDALDAWYAGGSGATNAAGYYVKAFQKLQLKTALAASLPFFGSGEVPALGSPIPASMKLALAELLKSNTEVLRFLAEGTACGTCSYPLDFRQGYDLVYRPTQKLEQAAFLLSLAALYHAESHEPGRAGDDLFIVFSLADSLAHVPAIFPQLLRRRVSRCALAALEQTVSRCPLSAFDADKLTCLLAKMEAAECRGEFLNRALAGERAMSLAALDNPRQLARALSAPDLKLPPGHRRAITSRLRSDAPLTAEKAFFEDSFQKIAAARQSPLPERLKADQLGAERCAQAQEKGMVVLDLLLPSLGRRTVLEAQCLAHLRVACTALALQRYWAGHGHCYPERLAQLVPEFLDLQPADPFDGKPLQYHKAGDGFTLANSSPENNTPLFSVIRSSRNVASF